MISSSAPNSLGFSLNPIKAVKTVVQKTVVAPTKFTAKAVYQAHAIPTKLAIKATKFATALALKPITNKLNSMKAQRAKKLSLERRKSPTPNAAENAEARSWVKSQLSNKGPHGKVLALLAGAHPYTDDGVLLGAVGYQLGVAPAVAAALIPVLAALLQQIIKGMNSKGELQANANVSVNAQVPQQYVQAAQAAQQAYAAGQQIYEDAQNYQPPDVDAQASFDVNVDASGGDPYASGSVSPYAEQSMQGALGAMSEPSAYAWGVLAVVGSAAAFGFWRALK